MAKQLLVAVHLYLPGMDPSEKTLLSSLKTCPTDSTQGGLCTETSQLLLGGPTF